MAGIEALGGRTTSTGTTVCVLQLGEVIYFAHDSRVTTKDSSGRLVTNFGEVRHEKYRKFAAGVVVFAGNLQLGKELLDEVTERNPRSLVELCDVLVTSYKSKVPMCLPNTVAFLVCGFVKNGMQKAASAAYEVSERNGIVSKSFMEPRKWMIFLGSGAEMASKHIAVKQWQFFSKWNSTGYGYGGPANLRKADSDGSDVSGNLDRVVTEVLKETYELVAKQDFHTGGILTISKVTMQGDQHQLQIVHVDELLNSISINGDMHIAGQLFK